jgi:hypothetical protein
MKLSPLVGGYSKSSEFFYGTSDYKIYGEKVLELCQ